jgi:hypothetical protein
MTRYVMVLRGATLLRGALEGVGPEKRDFLSHEQSECHLGPKSLDKNDWYIGSFMYLSAVV